MPFYSTIEKKVQLLVSPPISPFEKICPSRGRIGQRFGVDLELASDLSRRIGVSERAEYWEKVQRTSARPHIDLVLGGNGTCTHLTRADI
jgi:hypothetical protein